MANSGLPSTVATPNTPLGNTKTKVLKSVRVRMYRHGLGDCFLITFTNSQGEKHHIMIDCGVLPMSSGANQRLDIAVQNILQETGGHIHTLVATHEHADHISGFQSAREYLGIPSVELFDEDCKSPAKAKMANNAKRPTIDKVWLAWTENPEDEQRKQILQRVETITLAVQAAALGMGAEQRKAIDDILLFNGAYLEADRGDQQDLRETFKDADAVTGTLPATDQPQKPKYKLAVTMAKIMNSLRCYPVEYLEPEDNARGIAGFGVKVHILGPSRKIGMLNSGGESPSGHELRLKQSTAFMAAAVRSAGLELEDQQPGGLSQADLTQLEALSLPFDRSRFIILDDARKISPTPAGDKPDQIQIAKYIDFFQKHYGFKDDAASYGDEWRRIDKDWLQMGETLALQQVSVINNTSLVLAFELEESGKVLLFPGDAELESWEKWHENPNMAHLLNHTVLYKVGHHGSINATDQEILKSTMTNPDLVALIPVDMARANENVWEFPAKSLFDVQKQTGALFDQTRGRILVAVKAREVEVVNDGNKEISWERIEEYSKPAKPPKAKISKQKWAQFTRAITLGEPMGTPLWVDYTINL